MTPRSVVPPSLRDFYQVPSPDLLQKCHSFDAAYQAYRKGCGDELLRVTLTSGLDHHIRVRGQHGEERELICFDSNSYLHLHRHPRVIAAVNDAVARVGYGTASAQILCGTNRYLRELEDTLSEFHGREETVVFPSGFAANLGAITALVRRTDFVARDHYSHTSIHDGCRASGSRFQETYPHLDCGALERLLAEAPAGAGKLIVSDGVFSMHGDLAPVPELISAARRHGAYLMLDDAHGVGVVGPTGRGTEEHYGRNGEVDVLMGTFSKAPGTIGGYVTGSRAVVSYLRYYANAGMFTASLPAALCAGVTEAFRVMAEEPEHRERLWQNVRALAAGLRQVGFDVPAAPASAILPVFLGNDALLWRFGSQLFAAGIKAGIVGFPAVPAGESILRLAVNARHTPDDLARTIEAFERLGRSFGVLRAGRDEIRQLGARLAARDAPTLPPPTLVRGAA